MVPKESGPKRSLRRQSNGLLPTTARKNARVAPGRWGAKPFPVLPAPGALAELVQVEPSVSSSHIGRPGTSVALVKAAPSTWCVSASVMSDLFALQLWYD